MVADSALVALNVTPTLSDSLARVADSLEMVRIRIERENRAREHDILARTLEILPEDTLAFEMPLDGDFYGVTFFPDPDSLAMQDPRLQDILNDGDETPIVQDKQRGKSGEWEYLNQPF